MLHYRLYFWIYIVRSLSKWRIYRMFIVRKRWHPIHGARVKRKETVLHGLERKRRISARVVMSYAAGSRQVVEWNRYLLGKIITVLFLSSVLPSPFLFSLSLSLFIFRRQQSPRTKTLSLRVIFTFCFYLSPIDGWPIVHPSSTMARFD